MTAKDKHFPYIKKIIGISNGKGGTGKSYLTKQIASQLANLNYKVGILDAEILSPTQHILFQAENELMEATTNQHGQTIAYPVIKNNIKIASMGFV